MAEPLNIIAFAAASVSLAQEIRQRLTSIALASNTIDIFDFRNELMSHEVILRCISVILRQSPDVESREYLDLHLHASASILTETEQFFARYHPDLALRGKKRISRAFTRVIWVKKGRQLDDIKRDLRVNTAKLAILLNLAQISSTKNDERNDLEIIIAVLGPTGAGKSRFIRELTGGSEVIVDNSMKSKTQSVKAYSITIDGRLVTLFDTPGFDDTLRGGIEVLTAVAELLSWNYKSAHRLDGLVFMQSIDEPRYTGTTVQHYEIFKKFVGIENYSKVLLLSSKWDLLLSTEVGLSREAELRDDSWAPLIKRGSRTGRFYGNRASALQSIGLIAFDQRFSLGPLAIQRELVDDHKTLEETAAGRILRQEMLKREEKHESQLAQAKEEANLPVVQIPQRAQEGAGKFQRELDITRIERKLLHEGVSSENEQMLFDNYIRIEWNNRIRTLENPLANIKGFEMHEAPPAYAEHSKFSDIYIWRAFIRIIKRFRLELTRFLRPKLASGQSRLEWTCSCGDLLYGDFKESSPGSVNEMARELGAVILAGPASNQSPRNSSDARVTSSSPSANVRGMTSSSSQSQNPVSGQGAIPSNPWPSNSIDGGITRHRIPTPTRPKNWLEICTTSRPRKGFRRLNEIDVTSATDVPLSDKVIFEKIREEYERNRVVVKMFSDWSIYRPDAGSFTMFLTDIMPKVAITPHGPSVPPKEVVVSGRYEYNHSIAAPPMPPEIFLHYMTKVTSAHNEAIWTSRFPRKRGDSLFYNSKPLAEGWGVEIQEARNWTLFFIAQLIGLLLSGAAAAAYALGTGDKASGIAIGSWCSTVQALLVAISFFRPV